MIVNSKAIETHSMKFQAMN